MSFMYLTIFVADMCLEMPAGFRDISTGLEKHIDFLRQNLDAVSL